MDEKNFEEVYRRYFDPVYRYLLSLDPDAQLAEELTQETFFRALEGIGRFRGDSSVKTWLCSIAKNLYLSERRRRKPVSLEEVPERSDEASGPEEQAIGHAESLRLHQKLHALPEPYREVFSLRAFAQLSFREIGSLFGKSENWACVVYHRARARLKDEEDAL